MVDPLSVPAVTTFLMALNQAMAGETAKSIREGVAVLARRCAGRPVPAPADPDGFEELARILREGAAADSAERRNLIALMRALPETGGGRQVPRQLPPSAPFFTDRRDTFRALDRECARGGDGRPRMVNLHGGAGMGVTSAAVQWGWREQARFPDGQIYLDLRGDGPAAAAMPPATVLQRVLGALGLPVDEIPAERGILLARYRDEVADRRLLIVLDNVRTPAQVRDLVTSAPGVFLVLISRSPLLGLCTPVRVGPLPDRDARRLLGDLMGDRGGKVPREVLAAVLGRCQGSPWALETIAPHLLAAPERTAAALDPAASLDTAVLDAIYTQLSPEVARAYRLLALRPWQRVTPSLAACTLQLGDHGEAGALLAELADRHLLERAGNGDRYTFRPLVREHAARTGERTDRAQVRTAALRRTLAELLRTAAEADYCALPHRWHLGLELYAELRRAGRRPYATPGEALAALAAARHDVVEAVRAAEELGDAHTAAYLCQALWPLQLKAGFLPELLPALSVAARLADQSFPGTELAARMHVQLGFALAGVGRRDDAEEHLRMAAEYDRQAGHLRGQATAVETLGLFRLAHRWEHQEALELFEEADRLQARITPDMPGHEDVFRARALLTRHRGRALRALDAGRARAELRDARRRFQAIGDRYNEARTLTDLADSLLDEDDTAAALPLLEEAIAVLEAEGATAHLPYAFSLRDRCLNPPV